MIGAVPEVFEVFGVTDLVRNGSCGGASASPTFGGFWTLGKGVVKGLAIPFTYVLGNGGLSL